MRDNCTHCREEGIKMYVYCDVMFYDSKTNETVLMKQNNELKRLEGKPLSWLNKWCLAAGSSLKGREDSFKYLCGIRQKPCILVNEVDLVLFLPTHSIHSKDCVYVQYKIINKIMTTDDNKTILLTKEGFRYELDSDSRILKKQYKRATDYLIKLHLIERKFIFIR